MEDVNVKQWYKREYPTEEDFANDIDEALTFEDIYKCFNEEKNYNERVENILHKFGCDSDVRDRILEEVEKRYNLEEDTLYDIYENYMEQLTEKLIEKKKKGNL